jgi:hypothetical protein
MITSFLICFLHIRPSRNQTMTYPTKYSWICADSQMHKRRIAANPAPGIRVFSRQFLHSSGQQMILIGFYPLRKMLRNRNVTSVKKMTEKAFFVDIVMFVRGGTPTGDFAQQ